MVAAKKTTTAKTAEPKAPRKPRVPKPVTDLATANAAFQAAKRKAERATERANDARADEQKALAARADAAKVLKGYLGEVESAVGEALPAAVEDGGYNEADFEGVPPYEGDGYGDTSHTA